MQRRRCVAWQGDLALGLLQRQQDGGHHRAKRCAQPVFCARQRPHHSPNSPAGIGLPM